MSNLFDIAVALYIVAATASIVLLHRRLDRLSRRHMNLLHFVRTHVRSPHSPGADSVMATWLKAVGRGDSDVF